MSLHELEKTAALQILAYLFKKDKATRTDLRENIKAAMETIYSALKILDRLDLIEERSETRFPFKVTIHLTDKGRRVAEYLSQIEKILEEG